MRRIMLVMFLMYVSSLYSGGLNKEEKKKLDNYLKKRDVLVDLNVKRIVKEINVLAKLGDEDDFDALYWNPAYLILLKELYNMGCAEIPQMMREFRNRKYEYKTRSELISQISQITVGFDSIPRKMYHLPDIRCDSLREYVILFFADIMFDKSESYKIRYAACDALEYLKDTLATPYLLQVVRDKDDPLRVEAAHAFVFIPDERALPTLIEIIKSPDEPEQVKWGAIFGAETIGKKTGNRTMVEPLLEIIRDGKPGAGFAITALGGLKEKRLFPILRDMVEKGNRTSIVIWALGNIGGPEAREILIKLLQDKEQGVRRDAVRALLKMRGEDKNVIFEIEKVVHTFTGSFRKMIEDSVKILKGER